jgi:putative ABC transport system substrate-binding protein
MNRRVVLGLAALGVWVVTIAADARQPAKVWRLGILSGEPPTESLPVVTPFLEELQKLGYAEGRNIAIEWRWAEARNRRLTPVSMAVTKSSARLLLVSADGLRVFNGIRPD